ncbi:MAG: SIR2 family protein, partial [Anaerolineae bacterium]
TRLAQLIVRDNAVLFVGTGLRQGPDQPPAVQQIADALAARIQYQRPDRSLPAVARDFEVLQGRSALILALREELERLGSQPAPIHQLIADAVLPSTKVITTRFDRALEQALEQFRKPYVLIVRDTDLPFFDESKVTLIKMQGDISQPDSLVITEDDVYDFISKLPTISDVVRAFFATKTLMFLGYDLNSDQFKGFFRQVTRNLTHYRRTAYAIVSEPLDDVEKQYWQGQNVEICPRDPVAFLDALAQAVKAAVKEPGPVAPDPLEHLAQPPLPARPYKGLDSFTGADVAIFTGRTEESQRLTNRILAHRLTVLYGESGSGKTSLLQAGAGPRLAQRRALLATCVPAPGRPLPELMRRSLTHAGEQATLPAADQSDLLDIIREWQRVLDGPIVLAVDQFEQFFLAYSPDEQQTAIAFLNAMLDDRSLDLRLVLVLREDFLGRLQALEAHLPSLLDVRFRLERLGREAARVAIEEPARLFGVTWEPALVETLLDDLYEGAEGGVAPPQLQIVCDRLYQEAVEQAGDSAGDDGVQITLALFRKLGGTAAILGNYLDQAVLSFRPEQQPTVRTLLGALVSSSGVKQRLALEDLARAADVEPAEAAAILDELTRQRLIQRYEITSEQVVHPRLEYELTHDYLVSHIARWLGDDFWTAQKVREILRQSLPEWESRGRLLAPDDLRLAAAQQGRVRLSDAEVEMLYAAAVGYDEHPSDWQASLSDTACRRILLRLLQHPEAFARRQGARRLAVLPGDDVSAALAQAAIKDPDPSVREATARAIAELTSFNGRVADSRAVEQLVEATADPATVDAATEALVTVRDLQPTSHELLPADLRSSVRRQVWTVRWKRNQHRILRATLQGLQGGFWGLALGMGIFLGLWRASLELNVHNPFRFYLGFVLLGMSVSGVMGALAVGSGTFAGVTLRSLQDYDRPVRTWAVMTLVSAVFFSLGLVLIGYVSAGSPQPDRTLVAGLLIGLGVAGTATLPLKLGGLPRLVLTALVGMVTFIVAGQLALIFNDHVGWLLLMGGAAGTGFFLGLNPDLRHDESLQPG